MDSTAHFQSTVKVNSFSSDRMMNYIDILHSTDQSQYTRTKKKTQIFYTIFFYLGCMCAQWRFRGKSFTANSTLKRSVFRSFQLGVMVAKMLLQVW